MGRRSTECGYKFCVFLRQICSNRFISALYWTSVLKPKEGGHSLHHQNSSISCCFAITFTNIHKFRYSATDYNTAGERGSYFVNDQTLLQSNLLPFCFRFIYSGFSIHSLKTAGILLRLKVIFPQECIISELPRIKDHFQNGSFFPAFSIVEGVKIG